MVEFLVKSCVRDKSECSRHYNLLRYFMITPKLFCCDEDCLILSVAVFSCYSIIEKLQRSATGTLMAIEPGYALHTRSSMTHSPTDLP